MPKQCKDHSWVYLNDGSYRCSLCGDTITKDELNQQCRNPELPHEQLPGPPVLEPES